MELKLLVDKTKEIFAIDDVSQLGDALLNSLDNFEKLDKFSNLVSGDLSKDWLQMIYQYYLADRKEKKQDYTPESLASLMGKIIGKADVVIDMCAGSGALTIQKWKEDNNQKFELFELDKKVIPFLLFNCVLRNIEADVYRKDVLQDEVYEGWIIRKGESMGSALVSNPPYNMSWKPPALAHFDKRFMGINVPPKSNANYAFILTGLQISDKSCFLLPTSVLNPSGDEKNILKTIVDSNLLKAVILLPDNMFESTAIATALLIFEHERMTRNIAMINLKDSYIEEVREQRGQFGGGAHENRVYKKTLKALSDETIEHVVEVIEQQKNVDGICRIVTFNEVREKDYDIRPILYLHSPKEEAIHRSFKDIATDHRKIVRKKNAVKITINETIAKTFGIYDMYKNKTKSLSESFSAVDEETEEEDFITFTKNAEFKITCRTNVDSIPEIILYFMGLWKQQMMILNNDENRVLAEFRDALQSELFSGRIKLDKNGETEEKR